MGNPFDLASGTTFDLQNVVYNPDAPNVATPREEGFTLRNRINWSNAKNSANLTADGSLNANKLRILTVPSRTLIKALSFGVVPGSNATAHAFTSASSSAGGSTVKFEVGVQGWKSASQSSIKTSTTAFKGSIAVAKTTGVITGLFGTVATSTPWTQAINVGASSTLKGIAFPFGGFVTMNLKDSVGSNCSQMSNAKLSGTLEIKAQAEYMPE